MLLNPLFFTDELRRNRFEVRLSVFNSPFIQFKDESKITKYFVYSLTALETKALMNQYLQYKVLFLLCYTYTPFID